MDRVTHRLIVAFVVLVILCGTLFAFLVGYNFGVKQISKPVKGVYNIEYHNQTGKVMITTKIQYIEQEQRQLIIHGEPVFEGVE